ncbi:lipid II flippase MurJ [Neptuniibacter sp. QD57_21]|uniref:lipid II flippase MurJ n=1 Tax=Neptuniibacter sp. QD57_21 TaxID=3398213 RepID=UPI0039F5D7B9
MALLNFNAAKAIFLQFSFQALGLAAALLISVLLAFKLGAGIESDIFFLARRVITGFTEAINKAMVVVYIPVFIYAIISSIDRATKLLTRSLIKSSLLSCCLVAILLFLSDEMVSLLASDQTLEQQAQTVSILNIFILLIPAAVVSVVLQGFCKAVGYFGTSEFGKLFPRIFLLLALFIFTPSDQVAILAYAFVVGYYVFVLYLLVCVLRYLRAFQPVGSNEQLNKEGDGLAKRRGYAMIIVLLASQIGIWLETHYALSSGEGGLSLLEYAQRLGNLVPGVLSFSIVGVFYTVWCREFALDKGDDIQAYLLHWLAIGLLLIIPISVFTYIYADSLVYLFFYNEKFTMDSVEQSALLMQLVIPAVVATFVVNFLIGWVLANPAFSILKIISIYAALDCMARLITFEIFSDRYGLNGVAIAISLSTGLMMLFLIGYCLFFKRGSATFVYDALLLKLILIPIVVSLAFFMSKLALASQGISLTLELILSGGIGAGVGVLLLWGLRISPKHLFALISRKER